MLKVDDWMNLDGELAATVDNFSTEIIDKAWKYNMLPFHEKCFPPSSQNRIIELFDDRKVPKMIPFIYYSRIIAIKIYRLNQQ